MNTELVPTTERTAIEHAGQVANVYAAAGVFADYRGRKAQNTLDAQRADLGTFAEYLRTFDGSISADKLQTDAAAWRGVTHGLVAGFVRWMLTQGFALGTVNRKLSTVRVYAKLAAAAGVIAADESTLIAGVAGYSGKEGKRQDEERAAAGTATRTGAKKAQHVKLAADQVQALKAQPDTPQGRRDAVIMALLLDHGLRVGELALLMVTDFDLKAGTFTFYRPKVDKTQTHKMSTDTLRAVVTWLHTDAPAMGALLRGSRKGGRLTGAGMSERAITERVHDLGAALRIVGLSAHDCRHSWATRAAKAGTDTFALRDAGGWNSLAMPGRYVESAAVANERVKLD